MTNPDLNISYGQDAKADPYRITPNTNYKLVCSKCNGAVKKFLPKSWDGSTELYYRCVDCSYFGPEGQFKHIYKSGPMGSSNPNALNQAGSYTVLERRRTKPSNRTRKLTERSNTDRTYNRDQKFTATEDNIPKLGNKPDYELESLVRGTPAIITSIVDSDLEEDSETSDNYTDREEENE